MGSKPAVGEAEAFGTGCVLPWPMALDFAPRLPFDLRETRAAPPSEPPEPEPVVKDAVVKDAVQLVAGDAEFVDRTEDPSFQPLGAMAGAARNAVSLFSGADPGHPEVARHACTGIAERAALLLEAARVQGKLPGVTAVRELERRTVKGRDGLLDAYHSAVALTLEDGRTMVIDWHATLSVQHPKVATPETF